ncbi:HAD family hydrolase [Lactococcus cremoris]|uniref:p-Ser-HPr phosphatase n=2 Tax=Lactococcus lactis subsp. cremoris TaxID=1359 RepID=A0A2A5SVJ7_LACLC|nr:HAD family hydrolase [Lactococcus cremoris]KGH34681.1 DNA gyrase subunit B [Lactococcus cremoris]MDR9867147.1 HAD family hydrolase [Lactococcus cremoris]PCS19898.1 P-Ser-HPr phosphatase [Lactococcus cremoris subsp. tructae]QSE62675.1 HAD family hydrolase [Lactococcus cremoris]WMX70482.1 HAD family hydrolase [Lactococcus cremoris]
MDYENYIWDLGGTLLDNYESSSHAFAATLWSMAERVVLRTDVYDALKVSTAYAVEKFASDLPGFLEEYKKLEAEELEKPILFSGAKKVLKSLSVNGKKNFMISHRNHQVLTILSAAEIGSYFTEVVTADNGFKRKPAPESINYLLSKYKLNPKKTVMIGDRSLDIEAGNAAGVETIYFDSSNDSIQSVKTSDTTKNVRLTNEPTHIIHELTEILL